VETASGSRIGNGGLRIVADGSASRLVRVFVGASAWQEPCSRDDTGGPGARPRTMLRHLLLSIILVLIV
jgi:hypothetical protein